MLFQNKLKGRYAMQNGYSQFDEQEIARLARRVESGGRIDPELYAWYDVKRGLRDVSGKGVLAGLTRIGEVRGHILDENELIPTQGKLYYRGIDIEDLVNGFLAEDRPGYEETCYLLLMGELPARHDLERFMRMLASCRALPEEFLSGIILKSSSPDVMNALARSVLALYSYDERADDISIPNVLRQCLKLIACFPQLAVYAYQACVHCHRNQSLIIHSPSPELGTAENILHMLRADSQYTKLEARLLDLSLVLHAEHGGGNNSSFIIHVATSTGTDTYSSIVAAIGSLKGPRHGGANLKVLQMMEDMKREVSDWTSEDAVRDYLFRLLDRQAFDRSGLIYGIGHAVYSLSDPRALLFKKYVEALAREKGLEEEYRLYELVERLAPETIARKRRMYKGVSANVDFYSGFVYRMLDIPPELFTPLFAISRIAGWSAHRIEELLNAGKIIRPAYKSVTARRKYTPMAGRHGEPAGTKDHTAY
jgi:citrate synthase